jgi:hypothetical protein
MGMFEVKVRVEGLGLLVDPVGKKLLPRSLLAYQYRR